MFKNKKWKLLLVVLAIAIISCTAFVACEENGIKVTFMDGETVVDVVDVEKEGELVLPANPTKTGYVFVGWYLDAELTQAYDSEVTTIVDSFTLYAKFEQTKLYITLLTDGGTVVIDGEEKTEGAFIGVTKGANYTLPTPTKVGYTFIGYTLDGEDFATTGIFNKENSIRVKASYKINSYNVDFYDGTEKLGTTVVSYGGKIAYTSGSEKLNKNGYTFVGWYRDAELTTAFDSNTDVAVDNCSLYAKFSPNPYVITVDNDNGTERVKVDVTYNNGYALTEPTKTGYKFGGYTLNGEDFDSSGTYDMAYNVTVKATWVINKYDVKFYEGTTLLAESKVDYNAKAIYNGNTNKEGYTFNGWYSDEELNDVYDMNTAVVGAINLYAKYTANKYVVTIKGINNETVKTEDVFYNAEYNFTEPTKTGYTFKGYTLGGEKFASNGTYTIAGNVTIRESWDINSYKVTIDGVEQTVVYGQKVVAPIPQEGYELEGLYIDEDFENAFDYNNVTVSGELTLYAKYTAKEYVITINLVRNDATIVGGTTINVTYGERYEINSATTTNVNFVFNGYTYNGEDFALNGTYGIANNITIVANWTTAPGYYNIDVYFINDGETYDVVTIERDDDTPATFDDNEKPANPSKTGYTFNYWVKQGTNVEYDFEQELTETIYLVAKYTVNVYTITVQYNDGATANKVIDVTYGQSYSVESASRTGYTFNGYVLGSDAFALSGTYNYAENITIDATWTINSYKVTYVYDNKEIETTVNYGAKAEDKTVENKAGYTFDGWYSKIDYSGDKFNFTTAITSDKTLYGRYVANAYTITVQYKDGVTANKVIDVTYGQSYSVESASRTGYTFNGYVLGSDAFALNGTYNYAENITIDATWTINSYKVTFVVGNEEDEIEIDYNDVVSAPETDPVKDGYTFDGWYVDQNYNNEYDFDTLVTKDITLYAKFTVNKYTITITLNRNDASVQGGISQEFAYGTNYSIADATCSNDNYQFVKYTYEGADFEQSGTYSWTRDITIVANWISVDEAGEADLYFVTNATSGYFKERENLNDKFTYVFVVGNSYTFNSEVITKMTYASNSGYITVTDLAYGKAFTADKVGSFTMTVSKTGYDDVTYNAKVVDSVSGFTGGTDYVNAWGASANRETFRNKDKGVMEVGIENYIPDLVATDVNGSALTYLKAGIQIVSAVDSESVDVSEYIVDDDGVVSFDEALVGKTISVTFAPKYIFTADTEVVTMKINAGINVYSNSELQAYYSNVNVREINVLRNIKAELSAADRYVGADGVTYAANGHNFDRGYEHGVYKRLVDNNTDTLKINGNFFTIDGSDLPYINNGYDLGDNGTGWNAITNNYVVGFVQVGIFLYYSAPTVAGNVNDNQYASRKSRDVKYGESTLTINNLNVKGNSDPNRSGETKKITVGGETADLITMSTSMLGIVNRGGTINMNNVVVQNTLTAIFTDGTAGVSDGKHPCTFNLTDSRILNSWQVNAYMYALTKLSLNNTYVGKCNGPAILFEDRPWDPAYIAYQQIDSELNADTSTVFDNKVAGTEAWFVAYNMTLLAAQIKDGLETQVNNVDTLVNAGANGQMGTTDVTYIDKTIIFEEESDQVGVDDTIEVMNLVYVVQCSSGTVESTDYTKENEEDTVYDATGYPSINTNIVTYYTLAGGIGSYASNFMPLINPTELNESTAYNTVMQGMVLGQDKVNLLVQG